MCMSFLVLAVVGLVGINAEVEYCVWDRHDTAATPDGINYLNGLYEKYDHPDYGWTYYDWPIYYHSTTGCLNNNVYVYRDNDITYDGGRWIIANTVGNTITTAYAYCNDDRPQDFSWEECTSWYIGEPGAGSYSQDLDVYITETDACPQLLCDTVDWVTDASIEWCAGTYTRDAANEYSRYDSTAQITKYLWFSPSLFSWMCGREIDYQCSVTTPSYLIKESVPQAWTSPGSGDIILLDVGSSYTHYLECSDVFSTPSPSANTPHPTRQPTAVDTPSPETPAPVTPTPVTPTPVTPTPTQPPLDAGDTYDPSKAPSNPPPSKAPTDKPTGPNGTAEPSDAPTNKPTGPNGTAEPSPSPTPKPTGLGGTPEPTDADYGFRLIPNTLVIIASISIIIQFI
eukprot:462838_1